MSDARSKRYSSIFHAAIRKYGKDNFVWEVLDKVMFSDLLIDLEKFYISKYNCMAPNGYNMTAGGIGGNGYEHSEALRKKMSELFMGTQNPFYGKHHTEETKNQLRAVRLGKKIAPFTEEHKRKISASNLDKKRSSAAIEKNRLAKPGVFDGDKNPFWGKHHPPETIEKIRKAKLGKKLSLEQRAKISAGLLKHHGGMDESVVEQ